MNATAGGSTTTPPPPPRKLTRINDIKVKIIRYDARFKMKHSITLDQDLEILSHAPDKLHDKKHNQK